MRRSSPSKKYDRHRRAFTPAPRAPHIVATTPAAGNVAVAPGRRQRSTHTLEAWARWRDPLLVAATALAVRLLFLALTRDTYDYDEFVALLLGRDWAHGAMPYRDFMFFHPPGVLVVTRAFDPLFHLWWPSARVLTAALDTGTAVLVGCLGRQLWGRKAGVASGLAYALSPVVLISAVRVGEDPIITFLGTLGLFLLLRPSALWSIGAGACLGLAIWFKYPAAYFLPVYVLASPRRSLAAVASAGVAFLLLMAPFHSELNAMYQQTVIFQRSRWSMDFGTRVQTTLLYWLAANLLAGLAVIRWCIERRRRAPLMATEQRGLHLPIWVVAGFLLGILFAFASQVYYHYFVVVAPCAALVTGWLLVRWPRAIRLALLTAGGIAVLAWGLVLGGGGTDPLCVTAAHLSAIQPTVRLIEEATPKNGRILADRFEYAYLTDRPADDRYFWNVGVLVTAADLEPDADDASAVILSEGASSGFPAGFDQYLDRRFRRTQTSTNVVWLSSRNAGR